MCLELLTATIGRVGKGPGSSPQRWWQSNKDATALSFSGTFNSKSNHPSPLITITGNDAQSLKGGFSPSQNAHVFDALVGEKRIHASSRASDFQWTRPAQPPSVINQSGETTLSLHLMHTTDTCPSTRCLQRAILFCGLLVLSLAHACRCRSSGLPASSPNHLTHHSSSWFYFDALAVLPDRQQLVLCLLTSGSRPLRILRHPIWALAQKCLRSTSYIRWIASVFG